MSTYTDLHNRIKENLTILRKPGSKDDGLSPQRVVLVNPENQFYGTFNGIMNIRKGTLSNLNIVGGTIDGTTLKNATLLDGDTPVPIGQIAASVSDHESRLKQAEDDIEALSAAHDFLSAGLSGAIDGLSGQINDKIDDALDEIDKRISGAADGIKDLSNDVRGLSSEIRQFVYNGVVYKGALDLHSQIYAKPGDLFTQFIACCLLKNSPLKNGWMWRIHLDLNNVTGGYVTVKDGDASIQLGEGDYIIIKNSDQTKYVVYPQQMHLADFDVIDAQDDDVTKMSVIINLSNEVKELSAGLSSQISSLSANLSAEISSLSANLSGEIQDLSSALSDAIKTLSANLSDEISSLSAWTKAEIDSLSGEAYQNFVKKSGDSIKSLSVEGDLVVNGSTMLSGSLSVEADDTSLVVADDEVKLQTRVPVEMQTSSSVGISARGRVSLETSGPVRFSGSNLSGAFKDKIWLSTGNGLADIYVNDTSIQATLAELSTCLDGKKFDKNLGEHVSSQMTAIQSYVDKLSGSGGDEGIIKNLSDEISSLRRDEKFELQLNKITIATNDISDLTYGSIGHFLSAKLLQTTTVVRNNTAYVAEFDAGVPLSAKVVLSDDLSTTIGHGDIIYIHELSTVDSAPISVLFSDLKMFDRSNSSGNTYILQAGVSRYEFESGASSLAEEIANRINADKQLSNDYVERIGNLSTSLSTEISSLSAGVNSVSTILSNAISSKVSVDNIPSDVNMIHISQDDYWQLVVTGQTLSNTLYVVSGDFIEAYGQEIRNVLSSTQETNAATVGQVNSLKSYVDDWTSRNFISGIEYTTISPSEHVILARNGYGEVCSTINCEDFVKDGMVSAASVSGDYLIIVFNSDAGDVNPISVAISSIFNPNTYYTKDEIDELFDKQNYKPITVSIGGTPKTYEKGATAENPTFTVSFGNQKPTIVTWRGAEVPALSGKTSGSVTATGSFTSAQTWTLSAHHENTSGVLSSNASATAKIQFQDYVFYGVAAMPETIDSAFVRGLSTKNFYASFTSCTISTLTADESQYMWFALPTNFGEVKFTTGGFAGGWDPKEIVNVKNGGGTGQNVSYYIYHTTYPNIGAQKVIVEKA